MTSKKTRKASKKSTKNTKVTPIIKEGKEKMKSLAKKVEKTYAEATLMKGYLVQSRKPSNDLLKKGVPLHIKDGVKVQTREDGSIRVGTEEIKLFVGYFANKLGSMGRCWYNDVNDITIRCGEGVYLLPECNVPAFRTLRAKMLEDYAQFEDALHLFVVDNIVAQYIDENPRAVVDVDYYKRATAYLKTQGVTVDVSKLNITDRFSAFLVKLNLDMGTVMEHASDEAKEEYEYTKDSLLTGFYEGLQEKFDELDKKVDATLVRLAKAADNEKVIVARARLMKECAYLTSLTSNVKATRRVAAILDKVENPHKYLETTKAGKEYLKSITPKKESKRAHAAFTASDDDVEVEAVKVKSTRKRKQKKKESK